MVIKVSMVSIYASRENAVFFKFLTKKDCHLLGDLLYGYIQVLSHFLRKFE